MSIECSDPFAEKKFPTKIEFLFDRIRGELHSMNIKGYHNQCARADVLEYLGLLEDEINE